MIRYCLLIISFFFTLQLHAQLLEAGMFDNYTKNDGLSDNVVTGIAEDSAGFLWISTQWGLNRFNGDKFVQYHSNNDSSSMPADDVYAMKWLDDHRLGVYGTGLHIIDTRTAERLNVFIPYHDKKYQFKYNMTMKVIGDKDGNIFVVARSGFYHFDSSYHLVYRFDYYSEKETPLQHFVFGATMLEIDANRLLIPSINGLYVYNKINRHFEKINVTDFPQLAEVMNYPNQPMEFLQVRPGEYFIFKTAADSILYVDLARNIKTAGKLPINTSTEIGWRSRLLPVNDTLFYVTGQLSGMYAIRLDKRSGSIQFYPQKQLGEFLCSDIIKDRENRLLIATNKGFLRQRLHRQAVETTYLPASLQQQFANIRLDDVCASGDKVYAIARQAGLAVFDRNTLAYEKTISLAQHGKSANYLGAITKINEQLFFAGWV